MRYLGGKSKIAKQLAEPILAYRRGRVVWEPFCGGLGMSAAWGGGPLLLSDACAPLIAMYQAYSRGWRPSARPRLPAERDAALSLPDTDPEKAFLRFGCGFGGDWKGGTTRDGTDRRNGAAGQSLAEQSCNSLAKTFSTFTDTTFACIDFLGVTPAYVDGVIYCDPPYAGTEGYAAVGAFDHDLFYRRCLSWAAAGAVVFISEFDCPIGRCVLSLDRARHVPGRGVCRERLFKVGP